MSTYKIEKIEFLTQMPENKFKGNRRLNNKLKREWTGVTIVSGDEDEPADHLEKVMNFIEDECGMLVGHVHLKCIGECHPDTPKSFIDEMPSFSGMYPAGWVWIRKATLLN